MANGKMTFRNSKIVYYGPHSCDNCGQLICKAAFESGGTAFTYPEGPIYPNTEWHPHICDPHDVEAKPKPALPRTEEVPPTPTAL
jgi:hypothetical protein